MQALAYYVDMDSKEMGERSQQKQKAKHGKAYSEEMRRRAMVRWQAKKESQRKVEDDSKKV